MNLQTLLFALDINKKDVGKKKNMSHNCIKIFE